MKCMYCKEKQYHWTSVVRIAIKKKGMPNRWKEIGYCCSKCEKAGKPVQTDRWNKP